LKEIGVPVLKKLKKKHSDKIQQWLDSSSPIDIHYHDIASEAVATAIGISQRKS
jgi:hypothetical protein